MSFSAACKAPRHPALFGTTEQAAEKGPVSGQRLEMHTAAAEAQLILWTLSARLKSCPDTKQVYETGSSVLSPNFAQDDSSFLIWTLETPH
jgi:hypothetical protein